MAKTDPKVIARKKRIKRIRKKFKDVDPEFSQIETLYGVGYKYKEHE